MEQSLITPSESPEGMISADTVKNIMGGLTNQMEVLNKKLNEAKVNAGINPLAEGQTNNFTKKENTAEMVQVTSTEQIGNLENDFLLPFENQLMTSSTNVSTTPLMSSIMYADHAVTTTTTTGMIFTQTPTTPVTSYRVFLSVCGFRSTVHLAPRVHRKSSTLYNHDGNEYESLPTQQQHTAHYYPYTITNPFLLPSYSYGKPNKESFPRREDKKESFATSAHVAVRAYLGECSVGNKCDKKRKLEALDDIIKAAEYERELGFIFWYLILYYWISRDIPSATDVDVYTILHCDLTYWFRLSNIN
ncbi:hypothetical protein Avbf_05257 [Armadillidium vulgare]|nr:hypothetical protein Avbf_05257 [Armadillidium vulgare]